MKTALFCISFLRKGEVLAYVGRIHNLKDLKDHLQKPALTWGPGVRVSAFPDGDTSYAPLEDHPLATQCEPSALYCWILEILYCNPKGRRAVLRTPSTEGRSGCLYWAPSKPKGPKGLSPGSAPAGILPGGRKFVLRKVYFCLEGCICQIRHTIWMASHPGKLRGYE